MDKEQFIQEIIQLIRQISNVDALELIYELAKRLQD